MSVCSAFSALPVSSVAPFWAATCGAGWLSTATAPLDATLEAVALGALEPWVDAFGAVLFWAASALGAVAVARVRRLPLARTGASA